MQALQSLTVRLQYRSTGLENFESKFSENLGKMTKKNVISQKLEKFEQSYLEERFATLDSTMTAPNYSLSIFKSFDFFEY